MIKLTGTCSHFGGPNDMGVSPSEGLAFIYEIDMKPELFLSEQPPGTTGLARRLNPAKFYIATRWDYDITSKEELLNMRVLVRAPKTGKKFLCVPADWGPHSDTQRVADLSPGLITALGISTDDEVEVFYFEPGETWRDWRPHPSEPAEKPRVVISPGHGLLIRGAAGPEPWGLDEVDEARKVVPRVSGMLARRNIDVVEVYDDTSTTQDENLNWLVDQHNSHVRDLDVSVHFNCYNQQAHGCEVYAISEMELAADMSAAMASAANLTDRGAKSGGGLFFCKHTEAPSVLVECCFVDHQQDVSSYDESFDALCSAIADSIVQRLQA